VVRFWNKGRGDMDRIFALATAPGRAGIAVVRISGVGVRAVLAEMVGDLPEAGRSLRMVRSADGAVLDQALILTFAPQASYTGEEVVELHLHGSTAVVRAVLAALGKLPQMRGAGPGEFTQRAMENGRLDLAQVEGLADLIDAETEAQRRQAMRVFSGALGVRAADWRTRLIRAAALTEATIDFADEDVPVDVGPEVIGLLRTVVAELQAESAGVHLAERIRDGFEVAIIGPPNAGKSTLLNRLAGRDVALISAIAGTTRDVLEVRLDLDGLPVTLLDTAGLGAAESELDALGMRRARARAEAADMRIHLLPPGVVALLPVQDGDIVVRAKADLWAGDPAGVSGLTGLGVADLVDAVSRRLALRAAGAGLALRERHRAAMMRATERLGIAVALLEDCADEVELIAEEIRAGIRAIDSLVGRVDVEDILGEVFARFCIGK